MARASGAAVLMGFCLIPILNASAKAVNKKVQAQAWGIVREALTSPDSVVREQVVQSLEFIDTAQTTNTLMSALRDESEYVRIWAARSLAKRGMNAGKETLLSILAEKLEAPKDATGPLAALVKMKALAQGRLRGEAAKVLGLLKDPSVIPVLKEAKRDNDGRVRDGAAVGLALLGDHTEGVVFASAIKDSDKGVRLAAAEALSAMGDPRFAEPLALIAQDPEDEIRSVVAKGLGRMKSPESADVLAELLTDPSGLVRENAAWALGEVGEEEKIPQLMASLTDTNWYVRIAAAEALGKLGKSNGLPTLEAALNSNDTDARSRAAAALAINPHPDTLNLAIKTMGDGNIKVRLGAAISLLRATNEKK